MPAPVFIEFQAQGVREVQRAFQSVEQTVLRASKTGSQASAKVDREKERAMARLAKQAEKWARDDAKAVEKSEKDKAKAASHAERERTRAADQASKERLRIEKAASTEQSRMLKTVAQDRLRTERDVAREVTRIERQKSRDAMAETRRRARDEEAELRSVARVRESLTRGIGGSVARGVASGGSAISRGALGMAGQALQLGGGFSISDSVSKRASAERASVMLSNSAYIPGQRERPDAKKILDQAKSVGIATNMDATDLIEGVQSYVAKSSDFEGGMANMEFFAKLAKGSGAKFSDVTKAAGTLRAQNENLSEAEMKRMLLAVVAQGKEGSVELDDLARSAGKITKSSSFYASDQGEMQKKLLGLSQLAIKTTGSPEGAATSISALAADTVRYSDKIGGVTDKAGKLVDPDQILARVFEKTGGNMGKIQELGYGRESMKLFGAVAPDFDNKMKELKQSDPKMSEADRRHVAAQAVAQKVQHLASTTYSQDEADTDFKSIMQTSGEQMEVAIREFEQQVGEVLVPELKKLGPVLAENGPRLVALFRDAIPAFTTLLEQVTHFASDLSENSIVKILARHPLGSIVGLAIAKEIGTGVIGPKVADALVKAIAGSSPAGGGSGSARGAGGIGLLGGVGVTAAVASVAAQGDLASDVWTGGKKKGDDAVDAYIKSLNDGSATATDVESAKKLMSDAKEGPGAITAAAMGQGAWLEKISGGKVFSGAKGKTEHAIANEEIVKRSPELQKALDAFILKMEKAGDAASMAGGAADPNSSTRQGGSMADRGGSNGH